MQRRIRKKFLQTSTATMFIVCILRCEASQRAAIQICMLTKKQMLALKLKTSKLHDTIEVSRMQDPNKFKQLQSIEKFFSTMIPGCLDRQGLDIRGLHVKIYRDDKTILNYSNH